MDPVTIGAVVLAIIGGVAGEAGGKLWDRLTALVRRPFRGDPDTADSKAAVPSGVAELMALEQAPADQGRAVALGQALLTRAGADPAFQRELESWWTQASQVHTGQGNVTSTISGGTQYGPVVQGRDFTGLTFNSGPPPQPSREQTV